MANYATLKAAISQVIKENGNKEITGAVMQTTLLAMVDSIASGYTFAGVATPSTSAGTPDENVFWIGGAGSYSNFGASTINVPTGCICVFTYNGSFASSILYVGGVVDISKLTNTSYASLTQALADVPSFLHIGGLEIMYQDSTSGNYVKYRLMSTSWSTTITDWQGIDDSPIGGSMNLIKSAGVYPFSKQIEVTSTENIIPADGYVALDGDVADINNIVFGTIYKHSIVPCAYGDMFIISAQGGNSPRAWAFIKSDGEIILKSNASVLVENFVTVAPRNSAYLVINNSNQQLCSYKGVFRRDITTSINNAGIEPIFLTKGCYIKNNEDVVNINSLVKDDNYSCRVISCNEGDYFTISAKGGISPRAYAFINSSGTILENSANNQELNDTILIAPPDSAYIVINNNISDNEERYSYFGRNTRAIDKTIDKLLGVKMPLHFYNSGDISLDGINQDGNTRIRTDYLKVDGEIKISTDGTDYPFVVYRYNDNYQLQSTLGFASIRKFEHHGFIRIKFKNKNTPSSDISLEVENVSNSCVITSTQNTPNMSNVSEVYAGSINTDGTDDDIDKTRCRTGYIPVNGKVTLLVNVAFDYQFIVYKYDENGVFVGLITGFTTQMTIEHKGYLRLKFRNATQNLQDISSQTEKIKEVFQIKRIIDFGSDIADINLKYNNDLILDGKVCISDVAMISASAANNVIDEAKGIVYCVYLASDENYGEQRKFVKLSKFYVSNPNKSEHFVVAEDNTTIDNINIVLPFEPNIVRIGNHLLISFYSNGQYYARKFDMATSTLLPAIEKMKVVEEGVVQDFSDANVNAIYTSRSLSFGSYTIFTCKHIYRDNKWWSVITTDNGGGILCTSVDGITWSLSNNIEGTANYESVIAFVGNNIYNLSRGSNTVYVSADEGATWTPYMTIPIFSTRPQLMEYKGKLLSIIPSPINVQNYIGWSGRNIIHIMINDEIKLKLYSVYGIVYPSIFRVNNDIYFIYSNGMLFGANYNSDGKDALYVVRVGEMFENEKFKFES